MTNRTTDLKMERKRTNSWGQLDIMELLDLEEGNCEQQQTDGKDRATSRLSPNKQDAKRSSQQKYAPRQRVYRTTRRATDAGPTELDNKKAANGAPPSSRRVPARAKSEACTNGVRRVLRTISGTAKLHQLRRSGPGSRNSRTPALRVRNPLRRQDVP
jgi:hypothetical protein